MDSNDCTNPTAIQTKGATRTYFPEPGSGIVLILNCVSRRLNVRVFAFLQLQSCTVHGKYTIIAYHIQSSNSSVSRTPDVQQHHSADVRR